MGSRLHGNDDGRRRAHPRRRGAGDGFPSARERREEAAHPGVGGNPRHPYRHSRGGGNPWRGAGGWVPVSTGTTMGGGAPHNRHSRDGARAAMGSRLHGNDGGTHIVIPAEAGIHGGGPGDGSPSPRGRRWAAAHPTIVIPATAGIHGTHIVIPAEAGIHGGGPGDGFPSPRERRKEAGAPGGRRRTHFPSARERRWAV